MELKQGNINLIGKYKRFEMSLDEMPTGVRDALVEYLENLMDHTQELVKADCQIIIYGYIKEEKQDE